MKSTSTCFVRSLLSAAVMLGGASAVMGQAVTVDGTRDNLYGFPRVWQTVQTNYGNNTSSSSSAATGSELVAAYSYIGGGKLNLFFSGNLQNGGNRIWVFLDTDSANGQNRLRGDNLFNGSSWSLTRMGDSSGTNGLVFDSGFSPDHAFAINADNANTYVDYSPLPTSSGGAGYYVGASALAAASGTLSGGSNPFLAQVVLRNGNTGGVGSGTASGQIPDMPTTGLEMSIPLSSLGTINQSVKVFVFIINAAGDFLSNQFLPDVGANGATVDNFGDPRGTVGTNTPRIDFNASPGTQYFYVQPRTKPNLWMGRVGNDGATVTASSASTVRILSANAGLTGQTPSLVTTFASGIASPRLTLRSNSNLDGYLKRSTDGRFVTMGGFDAEVGTAVITGSATSRTIATVDGSFAPTYNVFGFGTNVVRGVSQFDASYALIAASTGAHSLPFPAGSVVQRFSGNLRGMTIANNRLFTLQQTVLNQSPIIPTTANTTSTAVFNPTVSEGSDLVVADARTVYVSSYSTTPVIQKWVYNGSVWGVQWSATSTNVGSSARGLAVQRSASATTVYFVAGDGSVRSFIDNDVAPTTSTIVSVAAGSNGFNTVGLDWSPELWLTPTANNDTGTATEDTVLTVNAASGVLANDTGEVKQNATLVTNVAPAAGSVTLNANGSYTFTPAANFNGAASFTYRFDDGDTNSNTATVNLTVNADNDAPTLAAIPNQTVDELVTLNFTAVGNDIDGPSLTYSLINGSGWVPAGATINPTTGEFSWTPTEAQGAGVYNFSVQVSDGSLTAAQPVQVTVNEVNQNPTLAAVPNQTVEEGSPLSFTLSGTDNDLPSNSPAATLTYSLTGAPSGMTVDGNTGIVSWTPTLAQGPLVYNFTAVVTDGLGGTDSKPVQVTVTEANNAPVLDPIGNQTVREEELLSFTATANDPDAGQTKTFSLSGSVPYGAYINPTSGVFTFRPAAVQTPQTYTFTVLVTDNGSPTLSDSETITVTTSRETRTANAVWGWGGNGNGELAKGDFVSTATPASITSLLGTSRIFGGWQKAYARYPSATWVAWGLNTHGALGDGTTVTRNSPVPILGATGDVELGGGFFHTLAVTASGSVDSWGRNIAGELGDSSAGAGRLLPGTVPGIAGAIRPSGTFGYFSHVTTSGSGVLAFGAGSSGQLGTGNGSSPSTPVTSLFPSAVKVETGDAFSIVLLSDGTVRTAGSNLFGQLGDGTNLNSSSPVTPALSSVIDVEAGNINGYALKADGTVWSWGNGLGLGDGIGTASNLPVPVVGLTNVIDIEAGEGFAIALKGDGTVWAWGNNAAGQLGQGSGGGSLVSPAQISGLSGIQGIAALRYSAFAWKYGVINQAPVANNDTYSGTEDTPLVVNVASGVIANDMDDQPISGLSASVVSAPAPAQGSVSLNSDGSFTFTPAANFNGAATFTYKVNDGSLDSNTATVTINVGAENDAPTLAAIPNQTVDELVTLNFTAVGNDVDGPSLTYSLAAGVDPVPAGASINPSTGVFSWTPTEAQGAGVYNFDVVVSDGSLSDTKPVQVTVNEVNQNPTLAAVPDQNVNEGSLLTFGLSGTDLDLPTNTPAATLTYSLTGEPSGMTVNPSTGVVTWTPSEAQGPQVYNFTAVVTDGLGGSDSKPVQVTVAEVNAAPTLAPIGNQTVNELQTLAFVAAGSDTDNPAQTLTYGLVGAPLGATINPTSGAFSWTPAENQGPGSFTFDVTVTDGVATTSETITVTVNEVNVAPVWNSIVAQSATEGVLFSLDVSPFASDSDTLPILPNNLTFTKFAGPTALSVSSAGLVTWTPGELDGGTSPNVTVRVTDDGSPSLFADVTFTINVAEANQAPTWATIPAQSASEHVAFSMSLSSFASDADDPANVLTYELVSGPSGLTVSGSGAVAWTPGETDGGTSPSVQVRVTDNGSPNLSADQTFTINVAETNSAPVLDAIGNQTVDEGTLLTITLGATDTDDPAQTLVYSSTTLPAGATLVGNVLTWTPSESQGPGDYPVTFTVNDGAGGTDSEAINIHVNEVNVAPTWTAILTQTATEHVHFTLDLTQFASDVDLPANNLTYALGHRTSGITVSPAGLLEWTPTEYDGGTSMNVQIVVSDNGDPDLFANHTFTINVLEANAAPALDAIPNQSVVATNLLTFTAVGSDPDDIPANGLTYSLVAGPDPVPAGASINPTTGVFTWTPTAPQGPGVYDFKVRVTDDGINPSGLFAEQPVHIVVDASNVAPTANNGSFTTDENTPVNTPVVATDPDLPAQTLSYTIVTGPTHGVLSGSAPNYVYTPFNHYAGPDSFTYKVNDGQADSNVATVSITVNDTIPMSVQVAGSSAPNAWGSPSWAGYRGNALTSLETTFGDDLGSRLTDPTAYDVVTTIPWSDNTATGWAFWMGNLSPVAPFDQELGHRLHFGVRVLGNGTRFSLAELEFDMNSSDPGNDMDFDGWFDGTDPFGVGPETYGPSRRGIDYGPDRVKGTMDDIVYNTDSTPAETEVDELIYVGVGNAWDATQEPGNTPAEQTESLRCYLEGLLSIAPINISTTYSIRDGGHSGPLLASGSATVTMVPTNVLPTANSQTVTVAEDDSVNITLVANDPDDATLTYTVVAGPAHGVLSGTGANRIYTPNANYNGPDSFTFKATDCVGDSNIATVTINVTPVNDDPVLGAIGNRTIDEMVPYSITLSSLDIDGGAPVYSATGLPSGASVTGDTFNWTPSEAQGPGNYVITFQVSDGAGGTDSETITIHVDEVNVAPTLDAIGDQTVDELTLVTFDANGADSDLPANTLTYSLIGAPAGASIDSGTGEFTWTPTEAQGGQAYAFTVRISDGTLHADRAVTITVNEVNSAPTLDTISNQTVNELTPVTFTASASDTDDPANSLTFSLIGAPSGASINPSTGAFTWTPSEAQGPQAHTFKVRVTDNGSPALFTEQNVTITVNEVNVAPVANAQTVGVEVNSSVNITLSASDVDLPANTLTYTVVGSPAHGNLSVSGANVVYTPNLNYTGPDSFTFKANDGLVDSNIATVDINVSGITVTLNLQLQGFSAAGPTTRGMTMFLGGTAGGSNDPVEVTRDVVFDATGHAVVVFTPADGFSPDADLANYAISVKDNLHTLRKTVGLTWNGSGYAANATLVGGNLNRDNRIDIGDYVVYATRYGTTPGADSPLSLQLNANFRHGDISGNGVVSTEEFTFISAAFGTADDALVTRYGRDDVTIRTKISVADAIREAGRDAQWLDRNGDGWISMDEATRRR